MSNKTTAEVMVDNLFCIRETSDFPMCVLLWSDSFFSFFLVPFSVYRAVGKSKNLPVQFVTQGLLIRKVLVKVI